MRSSFAPWPGCEIFFLKMVQKGRNAKTGVDAIRVDTKQIPSFIFFLIEVNSGYTGFFDSYDQARTGGVRFKQYHFTRAKRV